MAVKTNRRGRGKAVRRQTKRGLNKTEVKQVTSLANKVVKKIAETKYFNVSGFKEGKALYHARTNHKAIGVRGYATCENKNSQGVRIPYGRNIATGAIEYLDELNMNRCFASTSSSDFFKSQKIEGVYASPSFAQSTFILERDVGYTIGQASEYNSLNNAPYFVRITRVSPRASKFSTIEINPEGDLFVDEFGRATGVATSDFNVHQLMTYKLNSRKYKVIEDKSFLMAPPMIMNNLATGQSDTDPLTETNGNVAQYNLNNCLRTLSYRHNIGKKLFFARGGENEDNSTSGQQNEFILFHTCHVGVNSQAAPNSYDATDMLISTKSVSTFKDV